MGEALPLLNFEQGNSLYKLLIAITDFEEDNLVTFEMRARRHHCPFLDSG